MKTKHLLIFLLLIMSTVYSFSQERIIGGTTANITDRPYQAAIFINGQFNGGGVIVGNKWILTAAHVVYGRSASSITVSTGYTNLNDDNDRSSVRNVIVHEYYPETNIYDIALLELNSPLYLGSNNRKAIALATSICYSDGTVATVSGWGRRSVGGSASLSQLYKANVTIQSFDGNTITAAISNNMAYKGDSGGPLTINTTEGDVLIGLVKSGSELAPTTNVSNYTGVSYYYNWITERANIYTDAIDGPDLLCGTDTYIVSPIPLNCSFSYSPNIELVSKSGDELTVRAKSNGRAYITMNIGSQQVGEKYFWAGAPIVTGVTYDGSRLKAETAGGDASINHTDWTLGSNNFTSSSEYLSCPYSSGTYNVSVTAQNNCGTSNTYNGQVTINNGNRYAISVISGTKQVYISLIENSTDNIQLATTLETMMNYQLININTGTIVSNGSISSLGGNLNFSNIASGIYILRLEIENGVNETFKFMLK